MGNAIVEALEAFRCTTCGGGLVRDQQIRCGSCGVWFGDEGGVLDFAQHIPVGGLGERLYRGSRAEEVYHRDLRPHLISVIGGSSFEQEARWLDTWFRPVDGPIVELACGGNEHGRLLAERYGADRLLALDLDRATLDKAMAHPEDPGMGFVRGDAHDLPFRDASLGGVSCFGGLHLFPDPAQAIREVQRVLKPGAPFVSLTTRRRPGAGLMQRAVRRVSGMTFHDEQALRGWLTGAGLEIQAIEGFGWMILFTARRPL